MIGVNNVTIIGNIGTISEILETSNGAKFVNLTVATTEVYFTLAKEKKTNTQWHNIVLWNSMSDLQRILSKGDLIYIEGRLNYRKKSSTEVFSEIVAKNIRVLNKKNYSTDKKDIDEDFDFYVGNNGDLI
jgi:single-strand DNA-binding protein